MFAKTLDVIGKLSENNYGNPEVQVELMDIKPVKKENTKSNLSKLLYDKLAGF